MFCGVDGHVMSQTERVRGMMESLEGCLFLTARVIRLPIGKGGEGGGVNI